MSWWSNQPKNYVGQPLRQPSEGDYEGWFEAAIERPKAVPQAQNIRNIIRAKNPVRWWRFKRDVKWIQREMKKAGHNPEDWRWLV